jgi:hypothetical protein
MRQIKLRIAWSVAWGVVAVLLCVLWVRSYWWDDIVYRIYPANIETSISSCYGYVFVGHLDLREADDLPTPHPPTALTYICRPAKPFKLKHTFLWLQTPKALNVFVPFWAVILGFIFTAAAPWIGNFPRRFSLRTLLVATTLVAVALGLIVWASR